MKIFEYLKSIETVEEMAMFLTYHADDLNVFDAKCAFEWLGSEYDEADEKEALKDFFEGESLEEDED